MSTWGSPTVTHTFTTGRSAELKPSVPLMWLADQARTRGDDESAGAFARFLAGDVTDENFADLLAVMQRDIIEHAFRRPRVTYDMLPNPMPLDDEGNPAWVHASDLMDAEIVETISLVLEEVGKAGRFRGEPAGTAGSSDSSGVGAKPKRRARARAGES